MNLSDFFQVVQWWGYIFVIGLIFFPLTSRLFSTFVDKGYVFSKIIGMTIVSYIVFVLGVTHIAPFTQLTALLTTIFCAVGITILLLKSPEKLLQTLSQLALIVFEETIFLGSLLFWTHIRAHQPDILGLEKYMDFGFVNSILRSTYFPPHDMWYTPLPINYYYFGHLLTAVLTKLSGISSSISYNLMLATLFAFSYTLSFSLIGNIWHSFILTRRKQGEAVSEKISLIRFIPAGILGGFLVALSGNLHTIYTLFQPYPNDSPAPFWKLAFSPSAFPNAYWYPNATRFIYHTIHEFPSYSFVVSDLHGHVLDIPLVLTTLSILFTIITKTNVLHQKNTFEIKSKLTYFKVNIGYWVLLGFFIAVMYMTNAWDGMIYTLAAFPIIVYTNLQKNTNFLISIFSFGTIQKLLILLGCFTLFSLPFSLFFNPGALVGGIGLICSPQFLITIGKIGPFIFEPNHCMNSPFWQLLVLYGFFIFWLISFLLILIKQRKMLTTTDIFIAILAGIALILIAIPELFYLRDIYTTYFRANTMFKLVYQAFIIFSLVTAFIIFRFIDLFKSTRVVWKKILLLPYLFTGLLALGLVGIYPYFSINSYYNNLKNYKGVNGVAYLSSSYPSDAHAISWLNTHIAGQPVILEAQGDSYSDYARVSSNTGLPTVLGWPVHEWLWRGTYDIVPPRSNDIKTMYETKDKHVFAALAMKYHVQLVFVGQLEKMKYPLLDEGKFRQMSEVIFHEGVTTIYRVRS